MSIAGIAKEVTTIIMAAWFFGDELTPLNITGVAITACGQSPFMYRACHPALDPDFSDRHCIVYLSQVQEIDAEGRRARSSREPPSRR